MSQPQKTTEAIIRVRDLRLEGILGILPHERTTPQPIVINAELQCESIAGIVTDDISGTIDYAALCDSFRQIVANSSFNLLESLTDALLQEALVDQRVKIAKVSAAKPNAILDARTVEVELHGFQPQGES